MKIDEHQQSLVKLITDVFDNDTAAAVRFMITPHPQLNNETPGCAAVTTSGCSEVERIIRQGLHGLPV